MLSHFSQLHSPHPEQTIMKPLPSHHGYLDENNNENKLLLDAFDSEPGYYYQVVRSMLAPGHETELIYWYRSVGLIPHSQTCNNAKLNEACNKIMDWTPANITDFYQWKCRNCSEKRGIRENSIFSDVKCSFKNAIRILLGWCKCHNVETMAQLLGVKKHAVKVLYNVLTTTAKKSLKGQNRQLGGPGTIVLVDTFPEGCTNNRRAMRGSRPILCLAEVKSIPTFYWFEALDRFSRSNADQLKGVKEHILQTIQDVVLPGSLLVTRLDSVLCSFYDLQPLSALYPTIVTVEGLSRHNTVHQTIAGNLETIWRTALDVCEEAQYFCHDEVPNFLLSQMWHARFGTEAFEMLLNRLTDMR